MKFESYIDRFAYIYNKNYSIQIAGWCFSQSFNGCVYQLEINGETVDFNIVPTSRLELLTKFASGVQGNGEGFFITYHQEETIKEVRLYAISENEKESILFYNEKRLKQMRHDSPVDFEIDTYVIKKDTIEITGWASKKDEIGEIQVKDVASTIERFPRRDLVVLNIVDENQSLCGFRIQMDYTPNPVLEFKTKTNQYLIPLRKEWATRNEKQILPSFTTRNMDKAVHTLLQKGPKKIMDKVMKKNNNYQSLYHDIAIQKDVTSEQWDMQRNTSFSYNPKMSLVVATFNTPIEYLKKMVETVLNQSYQNWELCIADGSSDDKTLDFIQQNYNDNRIKWVKLEKNYGISGNMNAAIEIATGDYIGLYDHDDELTLDALFEVVKAINENPSLKIIYSDEDKINSDGTLRFEPSFKPDFNLDFLRSYNYICHLLFVKKELIDQVGLLDANYDGAQDHDFVLRCTENLDLNEIFHIQKVLYHWRIHQNSTAGNAQSKLYAFEAGIRAVHDHYKRVGIDADVKHGSSLGCYVSTYKINGNPFVSILIRNQTKECLESIAKSTYSNYEILDFDEYANAKGDYYIVLEGSSIILNDNWIEELLGRCQRKDVGIVGARLYYPDATIAHAGIIIGGKNGYFRAFEHLPKGSSGYASRIFSCMDLSAVSPYCMMIKKELFEPFNEEYSFEMGGIDLCLKVREKKFLVVYNPNCELETTYSEPLKNVEYFKQKWKDYVDPYYNQNLSLQKQFMYLE